MMIKTIWINPPKEEHPEVTNSEKLLVVKFINESSIEAISEKASRMRCLNFFDEPYDPPEFLS